MAKRRYLFAQPKADQTILVNSNFFQSLTIKKRAPIFKVRVHEKRQVRRPALTNSSHEIHSKTASKEAWQQYEIGWKHAD
jgi:hypothetical protein